MHDRAYSIKTSPGRIASYGSLFLELNLKKRRWLLSYSYNPSKENIKTHLETLSRNLASYLSSHDSVIVLGDFTVGVEEVYMSNFCQNFLVDINWCAYTYKYVSIVLVFIMV